MGSNLMGLREAANVGNARSDLNDIRQGSSGRLEHGPEVLRDLSSLGLHVSLTNHVSLSIYCHLTGGVD